MKSMKYSSYFRFLNVCIQFGSLSHWSTRPLVGQKASSIRNVKTTNQHAFVTDWFHVLYDIGLFNGDL